jgi:hypothetical protein
MTKTYKFEFKVSGNNSANEFNGTATVPFTIDCTTDAEALGYLTDEISRWRREGMKVSKVCQIIKK